MEGLKQPNNIGQTENKAVITNTPASLPEARKTKSEAKTNIEFIALNSTDLRLLNMSDDLFNAIANRMSAKGISANSIPSAL